MGNSFIAEIIADGYNVGMKKIFGVALGLVLASGSAFAAFGDTKGYVFEDSVEYLREEGIVEGYVDGSFKPEQKINRAEFTKMVVDGLLGEVDPSYAADCFDDVTAEMWYAKYICYAKDLGIVDGHPDGTYRPGEEIQQPEALKIIFNTLGEPVPENNAEEWYWRWLDHAEDLGMYYFRAHDPAVHRVTRGETGYFIAWLTNPYLGDQIPYADFYYEVLGVVDMEEEDCYEGEVYDDQFKYCYYPCEDGECYESDLGDFGQDLFNHSEDFFSGFGEEIDENSLRSVYEVNGDEIKLVDGAEYEVDRLLWELFVGLIPASYRADVASYAVSIDENDGTMASVQQLETDVTKWQLYIDPSDAYPGGEFYKEGTIFTLIHEFAHILTLRQSQVDAAPEIEYQDEWEAFLADCETVALEEGCPEADSYVYQYRKEFWNAVDEEYADIVGLVEVDEDAYFDALYEYYESHQNDFETSYAATNMVEDLAESFTAFVLTDKPDSPALVKDKKVLFFYDYPELVTLRNIIRKNVGGDFSEYADTSIF